MNVFTYSEIQSDLNKPHIINDKLYHIKPEKRLPDLNGKRVYLGTNEAQQLHSFQRIYCLFRAIISALLFDEIKFRVWFNKAIDGRDTIAIIINQVNDTKSTLSDPVDELIKSRQVQDFFEQGCRFRDGKETGSPDYPRAKEWFEMALYKNHSEAVIEWKKATEILVLNNHLEKQADSRSIEVALNAMIDLAAYYKGKGDKDQARKWINRYKKHDFKYIHAGIAKGGGNLLVTCNNNPEIYFKFMAFNSKIKEIFEKQNSLYLSCLQSKDIYPKSEKISKRTTFNGICNGLVMDFISQLNINHSEDFESQLVTIAKKYECKVKTNAIALQNVYLLAYRHTKAQREDIIKQIQKNASVSKVEISIKIIEVRNSDNEKIDKVLYDNLKQKLVPLPQLGKPGSQTDKDYLKKWLKEPDGKYHMSIYSPKGDHAVALFKKEGKIYLWDPNFGLIKCLGDPNYPLTNKFLDILGWGPIDKISKFLFFIYGGKLNNALTISRIEPA